MAKKKRKRGLADIGPNTRALANIRAGITGAHQALDKGNCRDAAALLRLTQIAVSKAKAIGVNEKTQIEAIKHGLKKRCKINLGVVTDQQWWDSLGTKANRRKWREADKTKK